jgi:serine/threonine-protein kinase
LAKTEIRAGKAIGDWILKSKIAEGGNGVVWRASSPDGGTIAIKFLKRLDAVSYQRFQYEVDVIERNSDVPGIIPLLAHNLSEKGSEHLSWYAMPLAIESPIYLAKLSPQKIVEHFLELAFTISELHDRNISHRDIKPANILALNDRLCLSDFGLVKFPNRSDLTPLKRDVGPKFTMAPEMRRHASEADGLPADVYSFAKSLWIALTNEKLGFDGQYSTSSNVSLKRFHRGIYTTTLDELLIECTDNDPSNRPAMGQVLNRLSEWLSILTDFDKQNSREWEELLSLLFPLCAPQRAVWTDLDSILMVLNQIGRIPALNHLFYPTGGGNTITGASRAGEEGFIELHAMGVSLMKPRKLSFESFGFAAAWNYIRLEADEVDITGVDQVQAGDYCEYLTEVEPGHYENADRWEYRGELEEDDLPDTARRVTRYLRGSFVIFSTRSAYNLDPATYDARHEKMGEDRFRNYIEKSASSSQLS